MLTFCVYGNNIFYMQIVTIPKTLLKEEELVLISRKEYEAFLLSSEKKEKKTLSVKRSTSFHVPKKHEKFYAQLDKRLDKATQEAMNGKIVGPFDNAKDLVASIILKK